MPASWQVGTNALSWLAQLTVIKGKTRKMNRLLRTALLATILAMVTGCYHATIGTDRTPSTRVIDERWASGWILGLVPPKTVETAAECADGVAMVETKLGFLNQVVGILTLGIYTPMHIRVTCAAPGAASAAAPGHEVTIAESATADDVIAAFSIAADAAAASGGHGLRTVRVGSTVVCQPTCRRSWSVMACPHPPQRHTCLHSPFPIEQ